MRLDTVKLFMIVFECSLLLFFCILWLTSGAGRPDNLSLLYHPVPDAAEDIYVARCFAHGQRPLLPIGNEFHPSRYSPIYPLLLSLYLRLTGGGLDRVFFYSPLIILAGLAVFYAWLVRGRLARLWRLLALYLILFSSVFVWASQTLMQEPTLFFLFSLNTLAWFEAVRRLQPEAPTPNAGRCDSRRIMTGYGLALFSGICGGAQFCIRPTIFILTVCYGLALFRVLPRRRAGAALACLGLGVFCVTALDMVYIHRLAGFWHTVAYGHWAPDNGLPLFNVRNAFTAYLNGRTPLWYYVLLFLGIDGSLTAFGVMSSVALLAGGFFWLAKPTGKTGIGEHEPAERIFRVQAQTLGLFACAHVFIHLFYFFHGARFFILAWPALVIFSTVGLASFFQSPARAETPRARRNKALALVLFPLLLTGFPNWKKTSRDLKLLPGPGAEQLVIQRQRRAHQANGPTAAGLDCPLFVDRLPVVNARLFLEDFNLTHAVAPLCRETDLVWDGHTVQFSFAKVNPPRGLIDSRPGVWPANPFLSYLYDPASKQVQKDFIKRLLDRHGRIAIYYPDWHDESLAPLFKAMTQMNCRRERLTAEDYFRLEVFSKARTPGPEIEPRERLNEL